MNDLNFVNPYVDMRAERAVLGSILLVGHYGYEEVAGLLSVNDFYLPRHGHIWDAMTRVEGEIDIITVGTMLGSQPNNARIDAYLADLVSHIPSSVHIESYAQIVKNKSITRNILRLMKSAQTAIMQGENIQDVISQLSVGLANVDNIILPKSFKDHVLDFANMREKLWDNPDLEDGFSWGLPMFDQFFGLIKPKNLIMVAGASKSGKSLVLAHTLYNLAKTGKRVGLLSLEMSNNEILSRLEEIISGVNFDTARADGTDINSYRKLLNAWGELHNLPIVIYDEMVKLSSIPYLVRQFRKELGGLDVLFIDYAGLIEPDNQNDHRASWEKMNEIAVYLKQLAISENMPVISAVQLNRQGFGKRPSMEYISGTIGNIQNANTVIAVWRPEGDVLEDAVNIYHLASRSRKSGQEISMVQKGLNLYLVERGAS